ncbi:four-carbon acid sugar kinase family protein [Caulobacter sp. KR2-114]|uniref:four-carbon acid sugar kinase family protein n=1 Tax=Caulobacter sp. KR2-114 TaxID=3400912 RepID=UPI003C02937E
MLELAVLADDLTGGMIIASKLEAAGVACPLVTSVDELLALPGDPTAVVLARKIRLVAPAQARLEAAAAAAAFAKRGARTIFYKYSALFESTDQGNIGPIAEALLTATGAKRTLFCPAYIDRGLTMYQGHIFIGSTLMSETAKRFDPMTPSTTSDVVAKLRRQTAWRVALADHQMLTADAQAIAAALEAQPEVPFWVMDAIDDADVAKIAAVTRDWRLVTGADSLPPAIIEDRRAGAPREAGSGRRLLSGAPGREAVIAGSCGMATMAQLEAFSERHPVWRIDLARDAETAGLVDNIAAWAADRLQDGPVAIATTADPAGVAAAQAAFGREGASERADRILGEVAVRLRRLGVGKFVIAGGETSGQVLKALDVGRLEVAAYDDLFGGYCHAPGPNPTSFVLKPGGLGDQQFLFNALHRLREAERHSAEG